MPVDFLTSYMYLKLQLRIFQVKSTHFSWRTTQCMSVCTSKYDYWHTKSVFVFQVERNRALCVSYTSFCGFLKTPLQVTVVHRGGKAKYRVIQLSFSFKLGLVGILFDWALIKLQFDGTADEPFIVVYSRNSNVSGRGRIRKSLLM